MCRRRATRVSSAWRACTRSSTRRPIVRPPPGPRSSSRWCAPSPKPSTTRQRPPVNREPDPTADVHRLEPTAQEHVMRNAAIHDGKDLALQIALLKAQLEE